MRTSDQIDDELLNEEQKLQEFFDVAIPKLLEYIIEKEITHILLLEKTARLLKAPLIQLFSKLGMEIKVGSYAVEYFYSDDITSFDQNAFKTQKKSQARKLKFLPGIDRNYQILALDEYTHTGFGLDGVFEGLVDFGFKGSNIHKVALDSDEGLGGLHPTGTLEQLLYNGVSDKIFNPFLSDDEKMQIFYPRLNLKHPVSYKKIIKKLTQIILNSVE